MSIALAIGTLTRPAGWLHAPIEGRREASPPPLQERFDAPRSPRRPPVAEPGGEAEAAFVARLRAGDELAFEELVRGYGGPLFATARRMLRSEEEARDAVQDAFFAAFRSIASFQGGSKLSTWLHRIVVNAALMRLRSRRRRPEVAIEELLPRFDDTGHRVPEHAEEGCDGDEAMGLREQRLAVRRCIDALPEPHRTVLMLRDLEELDTRETAQLLGLSLEAVKTRLHRARQALRTLLEREGLQRA